MVSVGVVPLSVVVEFVHDAIFVCRMYVFGGWIPFSESERRSDSGTQWICTKSLSVLRLGQFR